VGLQGQPLYCQHSSAAAPQSSTAVDSLESVGWLGMGYLAAAELPLPMANMPVAAKQWTAGAAMESLVVVGVAASAAAVAAVVVAVETELAAAAGSCRNLCLEPSVGPWKPSYSAAMGSYFPCSVSAPA